MHLKESVVLQSQLKSVIAATALCATWMSAASAVIVVPTVKVDRPGNPPDPATGYGSVPYVYEIGETEVTNSQYVAFLNAIAKADPNAVYDTKMAGGEGGIKRTGVSGAYVYTAKPGMGENPVNFACYWDACRFANWLHNGQPVGPQGPLTTEDGAYTITVDGMNNNTIERNANWTWAVTSENEWYKAGFYQPSDDGGDLDSYWRYTTSSNSVTTSDANFDVLIDYPTPVRSYAPNYHGVYDIAGNLYEWNEGLVAPDVRGRRGGSFRTPEPHLRVTDRDFNVPSLNSGSIGFRVVRRVESYMGTGDLKPFRPRR